MTTWPPLRSVGATRTGRALRPPLGRGASRPPLWWSFLLRPARRRRGRRHRRQAGDASSSGHSRRLRMAGSIRLVTLVGMGGAGGMVTAGTKPPRVASAKQGRQRGCCGVASGWSRRADEAALCGCIVCACVCTYLHLCFTIPCGGVRQDCVQESSMRCRESL